MWFWCFMLICDLLTPLIMIFAGYMMWKHPPKNINSTIGYRTTRSMKNMDTWVFAHEYGGHLWWKIGWIMLILSFLVHIPVYGTNDDLIGMIAVILMTIQILILIASVFPVEKALKERFTDDGILK